MRAVETGGTVGTVETGGTGEVVVTGIGVAVPGVPDAAGLLRSGPPVVGEADDPVRGLRGRGLRYKDRATKLALCAARDALVDAGLLLDPGLAVPGESVGVVASTNLGNVDTICDTVSTIASETYLGTSPMLLPATASNVVASWLAITFGLRGANLTLCNGPTSGLDAVHWARLLIAAGRVERVLVVGVEPANPPVRHLVGGRAADGNPRLFDGSAALVVESAASAFARGTTGRAEVGPYARKGTRAEAVAAVRRARPGPAQGGAVIAEAGVATADLGASLGSCSGALGVLQCVAGVAWLDGTRAGTLTAGAVLAAAGTGDGGHDGGDAAAAMILTGRSAPPHCPNDPDTLLELI